jgi:hypothetical protein
VRSVWPARAGPARGAGLGALLCAASLALAPAAARQDSPGTPPTPAGEPAGASKPARPAQTPPPQLLLGARSEAVRQHLAVIPTVVIVPDARSYTAAVGAWSTALDNPGGPAQTTPVGGRFPVFIDDESWQAREDIARFVRAFQPRSVVRWSAPADAPARWGDDNAAKKRAVELAAASAWGASPVSPGDNGAAPLVIARWKALGFVPPGLVVASPDDPAWTGALALAAGRGEIIAWVTPKAPRDPSGSMSLAEADAITDALLEACRNTGYAWDKLGDDLDAVTLCLNLPATVRLDNTDPRRFLATTDVIGRHPTGDRGARWAWAGQVFGSEARAAYAAMCALFLMPRSAWLFDAYENSPPWSHYDAGRAAQELAKVGFNALVNDGGAQGRDDWRMVAAGFAPKQTDRRREPAGGVDAGLVFVNSSGGPEDFDLRPGKGKPGDIPVLRVPAMVHFVHSFSAAHPGARETVAGRWLERGAYAYAGAVHEPYLTAFVPTPLLAQRLIARFPWGAAVRLDGGPVWKIAVFGDPLMTLGPPAPRTDDRPLPLAGAVDIEATLADDLKQRRLAEALRTLSLLGRDADAARLLNAIAADQPDALTPDVAMAGALCLYRAPGAEDGALRLGLLVRLLSTVTDRMNGAPELRDVAWHAAFPMRRTLDPQTISLLKACVRQDQFGPDVTELAASIERADPRGREAADEFLVALRAQETSPERREFLGQLLRR